MPIAWPLLLTLALAGCGGGGSSESPPPERTTAHVEAGRAVIKARAAGAGWIALTEKLRPLDNVTRPDRELLISADGAQPTRRIGAPEGWSIVDAAVHPSGAISVVLADDKRLRLRRLDAAGALLGESDFLDPQAATDPFASDPIYIRDSQSLLPIATRDAVRVAAAGEDLVLVNRNGRNAVVAQRLAHQGSGRYTRVWRTLVEPGVQIGFVGITSGTFDPFGSLDTQWRVLMDVDDQGRVAVAVSLAYTELPDGHAAHFGEPMPAALINGALVTRLAADGRRLGTTLVDTGEPRSEAHALRWAADAVWLGGRVLSERRLDGLGWNGYVARIDADGAAQAAPTTIDIDRGDIVLDLAPLADGRLLIAGATGYGQNPLGGSITEESQPLLAQWSPHGALQRLAVAAGSRHNQVRTLAAWRSRWLVGGLDNGPGTHSADGDPARLRADGWLREQPR